MIDCPFNLPLLFELCTSYLPGYGRIADANGDTVSDGIRHDTAAYIIRAVNNFEKMREALKPFAEAYEGREGWKDEWGIGGSALVNGDLRRAAAVLKEIEDE
jgi:hypothetical protein